MFFFSLHNLCKIHLIKVHRSRIYFCFAFYYTCALEKAAILYKMKTIFFLYHMKSRENKKKTQNITESLLLFVFFPL